MAAMTECACSLLAETGLCFSSNRGWEHSVHMLSIHLIPPYKVIALLLTERAAALQTRCTAH